MNKRLKMKAEKRKRQQICEVLDLCLQINGLQKSKQGLTGSHPTAYFYFSGHVAEIEADVYRNGWRRNSSPDVTLGAYITESDETERMVRRLKQLKKDLHSGDCDRSKDK